MCKQCFIFEHRQQLETFECYFPKINIATNKYYEKVHKDLKAELM